MVIRAVRWNELHLLRELSIDTFVDAFGAQNNPTDMDLYLKESRSEQRLLQEYNDQNITFLFVEKDEDIIGFMKINAGDAQTENFGQSAIELERIYLLKDHQGKGYGAEMLNYFEDLGRSKGVEMLWLGVWEHNPKAIAFYKRHGFKIFGKHDYLLGTDLQQDYLMRKLI